MSKLPKNARVTTENEFLSVLSAARTAAAKVDGYLTDKERHMLVLMAVCPTVEGEVLEIGSFKGLSTVLLATALERTNDPRLHACDPWAAIEAFGANITTNDETFRVFQESLAKTGVADRVTVHRAFSSDLAKTWDRPLRLLWIDGDHSVSGATEDFENFSKHVVPGGIVAFHDVMHFHPGPSQVFATRVLLSDEWGACGICGSIGWAQKVRDRSEVMKNRDLKLGLLRKLMPVVDSTAFDKPLTGIHKLRFKLRRSFVPRSAPKYTDYSSLVGYRAA